MKHFFALLFAVAGMSFGLVSCQKAPRLTLIGPVSLEISANGGACSISFTANREWSVSSSDSWLSVTPSSGSASNGAITVSIRCNQNTTYEDRTATVAITMEELSQTVTVKQPAKLGIIIPTQSFDLTYDACSIEVEVQANVQYSVSISDGWIKRTDTKGLTTNKLTFSVEKNDTYDVRSATITITPQNATALEQVISVKQNATEGNIAVDLGLSVKWASLNLGASKPWEYGDYYAWGETETKSNYYWTTYLWANGSFDQITKYCTKTEPSFWGGVGSPDERITLDLEDDAANVILGGKWRMPTVYELEEIKTNCVWTWTTMDGVNGCIVESKINGNRLFLPASGSKEMTYLSGRGGIGTYWSNTLSVDCPFGACYLNITEFSVEWYDGAARCKGASIRPVLD